MIQPGLQRISRLLARTPLPWRAIHVAGTNGKGSICTYISAMLEVYNASECCGNEGHEPLKHARFTSPHLIDRWDCIAINQNPVSFSVFDEVEKVILARNQLEEIEASEFELLTATAFEIFTREKVDVAVVEVGMGGRLDATNVIGQEPEGGLPAGYSRAAFRAEPLVIAISKLGMDHQAHLGKSLEDIAAHKAGIIKPSVPVVWDTSNPDWIEPMLRAAYDPSLGCLASRPRTPTNGVIVDLSFGSPPDYDMISHNLLLERLARMIHHCEAICVPDYVMNNTKVALCATWLALWRLGRMSLDDEKLSEAMIEIPTQLTVPGRQQRLCIEPLTNREEEVLLDGAHNADSVKVLASEVFLRYRKTLYCEGAEYVTWVMATSDSRDASEILEPLLKTQDRLVAIEFGPVDGMPWVKPTKAGVLLQVAADGCSLNRHNLYNAGVDVLDGLRKATELAGGGPLVVAGSLYLVSDVLRLLRDHKHEQKEEDG